MPVPVGAIMGVVSKAPTPAEMLEACGAKPSTVCRWTLEQTGSTGWAQSVDFFVAKPLQILLIVVVAYLINRVVRTAIKRFATRLTGSVQSGGLRRVADMAPSMLLPTGELNLRSEARAKTLVAVLKSLSTVVIYGFAAIYIVDVLGLKVGPLIAGAGIAGVAIGFGAQSLVRDFLSGIFILVEDQYGVGDTIEVSGTSGTVEEVTLRTTRLRDVNGTVWHVPNGEIRKVGNKSQQWARAVLDLNVVFSTDLAAAEALIRRVAGEVCAQPEVAPSVIEAPEVWGVENVGADGITERLVVKTTPGSQWTVMRKLRGTLVEAFDKDGIELSGAAGTVYVRKDRADAQASEAAAAAQAAAAASSTAASSAAPKAK